MKRTLVAALALGLAAFSSGAPVLAGPPSDATYEGGCGFNANNDPSGEILNPNARVGVIYAAVVASSPTPDHNPVTVTVTCVLKVNGGVQDTTTPATGVGAAFDAEDTSYVAPAGSVIELCDQVTTTDAHGQTIVHPEFCGEADRITIPPQEFWDLFDPPFCLLLATLFPDGLVLGPIEIKDWDANGANPPDPGPDIYVDGELFFDCPTYEPPPA